MSLSTLLLHDPSLASRCSAEVAAADPAKRGRRDSNFTQHCMLGPGREVQGGTMGGKDTFMLLQLESDILGPRFQWWDMGNLTFWMTVQDAAALRFDLVEAEIEGH